MGRTGETTETCSAIDVEKKPPAKDGQVTATRDVPNTNSSIA
jgi:hypothetical protein